MTSVKEPASSEISATRVLKGSLIVGTGLFSAQLAGFVRQLVIGYLLGTGAEADALSAAMAPIETWWAVLATAVIFGFAPMFSPHNGQAAYSFGDVLKPVARLAIASTVFFFLLAEPLILLFAPGLDADTAALGAQLLRWLSLSPAAIGVAFVYTALLFSHRHFAVASFHHATVNVSTIVGALLLHESLGVYGFAVGYVSGTFLHLAINHFYARRTVADGRPASGALGLKDLLAAPAPILAHALAMELNTAVTRAYASMFGVGMTAAFEFGFKLLRVPLALLVIPLSQSLLPEVASRPGEAAPRQAPLRAVGRASWLLAGFLAVVAAVMFIGRQSIVSLLFERGEFGGASTTAVAAILLAYTPVILGRGLSDFLSRNLFAMGRFRVALITAAGALAVNLVVSFLVPPEQPELIGLGAMIGFTVGAIVIVGHVLRLRRDA